ncbi:MAG: acyltransferase domain-containing protein [Chloroflexi bacterium]|nr:acyltransferase domain-containing protein [Chloroflexota bacterium]
MEAFAFLTAEMIRQNATEAGLDQNTIEQLLALAERIVAAPALQRCVEQLFAQTYQGLDVTIEPSVEALFGAEENKLYLLLAVDAIRQLRAVQQARGIPEAITRESFGPLAMVARRFAHWHDGQVGLEVATARHWFGTTVASGNLYRLGRLEFILKSFNGNIRVYQHKQSGQVVALAEEGVHFTEDGYLPFVFDEAAYAHFGWSKEEPAATEWTATIVEDAETITGYPISPYGYALRTPQQLVKAEWTLVLRNGDTVLDMHIPNFMPLQFDLLQASLKRALDFFPRYHADRPFKAFVCGSWLFNTQWAEMLPDHSNILAFQQQGYLFPLPSNGAGGLYFIFGDRLVDLDKAQQATGLQRAAVAHLQAGGKLRNGGFLLLPEDVEKFGQAPYRNGVTAPAR